MNKIFFFFALVFCYIPIFAQNLTAKYRFIKDDKLVTTYGLSIQTDYSLFYESGYCLKDVIPKSELIVFKDKSKTIKLLDKVGEVPVSINKPQQLGWIIKNDKKVIAGYMSQKAEVIYKNEIWTAWFTNELPFPDGPFIFNGLPGLILTIGNDEYKFELLEINKSKNECSAIINSNRKEISYEKYESLFNNISSKNDNLINSINNLNLKLETKTNSISDNEKKINVLREIL